MALINYTEISDGTSIDASDVNTPMNTIYDEFNGKIDSNNLANNAVTTSKITDGNVTSNKIDFTTFSTVYDDTVTDAGKTYNITIKGIYIAWGISSNTSGNPAAIVTMNGIVKAKTVGTSSGLWDGVTAIAVGLVDSGQTIVVNQVGAAATDNRSSVGMCLIQRVA